MSVIVRFRFGSFIYGKVSRRIYYRFLGYASGGYAKVDRASLHI